MHNLNLYSYYDKSLADVNSFSSIFSNNIEYFFITSALARDLFSVFFCSFFTAALLTVVCFSLSFFLSVVFSVSLLLIT